MPEEKVTKQDDLGDKFDLCSGAAEEVVMMVKMELSVETLKLTFLGLWKFQTDPS